MKLLTLFFIYVQQRHFYLVIFLKKIWCLIANYLLKIKKDRFADSNQLLLAFTIQGLT